MLENAMAGAVRTKGQVVSRQQRMASGAVGNRMGNFVAQNLGGTMQTPILSSNSVGKVNLSPSAGDPGMGGFPAGGYGASMSGAGGGFDATGLMNQYNQQYSAATAANTDRYNQGVQGYGDLYNRSMANLSNLSNQNQADIRQQGENSKSANNQQMSSLGLGGTTVGSTLNAGVDQQTGASLNRANDAAIQQRNATDNQLTSQRLGFIERRNDPYPDMGQYASLMMQMGQQGMGGGTSAAGNALGGAGGPTGNYGNPNGAGGQGFGSVIDGDAGTKQNIYTRAAGADGNGMSVVQRTPLEEQLAKNPFLLDSLNPGALNKPGLSSRYGAMALGSYGSPQMMQR